MSDETPPKVDRATKGPRHGDPRISAEEMIAEALVAAGLRAPGVRTYGLNSPEAHRTLIPPYPQRPTGPRSQSGEYVWGGDEKLPWGVKRED